ncbi:DUF4129 domain-containing protein [Consotaella aegiceratis]|uniref:DUF4129 domain-containing protein n=1 Tax=Consotaella aegiceratis TaxID=3097961 RepID=UPI002F4026E1
MAGRDRTLRTRGRLACAAIAFGVSATMPAWIDVHAAPIDPPRSESSKAFLEAVADEDLQTPIQYLSSDAPLNSESTPLSMGGMGQPTASARATAWIVLGVLAAIAAFALWRARGRLGDLAGPKTRALPKAPGPSVPSIMHSDIDQDFLARLRSEADPRVGLRLILQRFLALAAKDNALVLKRSLTTRELMRLLPESWAHRRALETLARRTELVVFGGREISRETYEDCLELATPFLRRTSA